MYEVDLRWFNVTDLMNVHIYIGSHTEIISPNRLEQVALPFRWGGRGRTGGKYISMLQEESPTNSSYILILICPSPHIIYTRHSNSVVPCDIYPGEWSAPLLFWLMILLWSKASRWIAHLHLAIIGKKDGVVSLLLIDVTWLMMHVWMRGSKRGHNFVVR